MMIAIIMLPVSCSKATSRMNRAWKTGVNSQAISDSGLSGVAGARGIEFGFGVSSGRRRRRRRGARRDR